MRSVYFIRHGTSEWNLLGRWQGQTDTRLAPEGELQAQRAAASLREQGLAFDAIASSDLLRAKRTAEILAAGCGRAGGEGVVPIPDSRLRECSLGQFEGLHKEEIFGPTYAALFRRLSALPHEARVRSSYFDGLECPAQIAARALSAAAALASNSPPGATVACVTHSVVLESLLAATFSKDFEGVHSRTLAWLRCSYSPSAGFQLEESDGESALLSALYSMCFFRAMHCLSQLPCSLHRSVPLPLPIILPLPSLPSPSPSLPSRLFSSSPPCPLSILLSLHSTHYLAAWGAVGSSKAHRLPGYGMQACVALPPLHSRRQL